MKEILVINPRHSKGRTKQKGVRTMATKKKHRRHNNPNPSKKRGKKRNPSLSGAGRAFGRGFMGLNFKKFLSDLPATQIGMWAAKFTAKKFSEDNIADTSQPESWNYASYIKGGLGTVAAAILMNMFKPGSGQKCLEGGLNLMTFFALRNEVLEQSEWAKAQFGESPNMPAALPESVDDYVYEGEDGPYFMGEDGQMYPADERHRLMNGIGAILEPIGPMGELMPVGPMGAIDLETYKKAWRS